jgi:hypothetical protein
MRRRTEDKEEKKKTMCDQCEMTTTHRFGALASGVLLLGQRGRITTGIDRHLPYTIDRSRTVSRRTAMRVQRGVYALKSASVPSTPGLTKETIEKNSLRSFWIGVPLRMTRRRTGNESSTCVVLMCAFLIR